MNGRNRQPAGASQGEGLEYVFLLLGAVPALGLTALAVVWTRVRRGGRALAC